MQCSTHLGQMFAEIILAAKLLVTAELAAPVDCRGQTPIGKGVMSRCSLVIHHDVGFRSSSWQRRQLVWVVVTMVTVGG